MLYYPSYLLEILSSDRVALLLISLCWLLTCFRLYHALSAIFIGFCSICPLQISKRLIKKTNRFVCLHVECVYGSWFDRELEWEEAAKKHPKNFYVLYYEDLKQVILHHSPQTRLQPLGAFRQGLDLSELCRKVPTLSQNNGNPITMSIYDCIR